MHQLAHSAALLFVLTLAAGGGCLRPPPVNLRGDGFQADSTLDKDYRSADPSGQQHGFSTKARSIESNLGVR
jgi:hypothetical protein